MSDFVFDRGGEAASQAPRKPRATLGSDDAAEIFASIDPKILGRFAAYLAPHKTFAIGALSQHLEFDAIYRVLALIPISLIVLAIPLVRRLQALRPAATSGVDHLAEGSRPERAR